VSILSRQTYQRYQIISHSATQTSQILDEVAPLLSVTAASKETNCFKPNFFATQVSLLTLTLNVSILLV